MRVIGLWLLSIFIFFMALPAFAVKVSSLYKGSVPVATQTATERTAAVQQALIQVLIKVSGNNQIINNPKLKTRLSMADTLTQQFDYTPSLFNNKTTPYLLEVQFDPTEVNQWLRDAGAATWGQNRPLIVAWIAYETPGQPAEIISADSASDITVLLKQTSEQQGLPLLLPVMDVTDLNQTSTQDILGKVIPNLTNASKRYGSDAILIGHIIQAKDSMISQWKLILGDTQWNWDFAGKNIADIAPALMTQMMTALAPRFAVVTTNAIQKDLTMKITGITHYPDFMQLTRYLNHLTPVANVEIVKILTNNEIILKVSLRSTQESFAQALSIAKKLTPVSMTNTTTTDAMVVYQWNP